MESIEVVETFFSKVWNERRLDLLQEIVDPKCVTHQIRSAPGPIDAAERGPLALKEHIESWLAAFPDITASLDLRCACGTDVISWVTMRGTHRRAWQGVPATGREVTIRTVAHHRVENGRIIEDWVIVETLGFFQQLGVVAPTQELLAQQTRAVT